MCKSIANQTTDWLTCKKQANQRPTWFPIDLNFQLTYVSNDEHWTYACTWSDSKSLRNGCETIVVLQICSKKEQNGGSCYCEDFITTWHENLNWTNLDTKQLFLQKAWLECDQIWVAYFFYKLFFVAVWPSSTWFCWQP